MRASARECLFAETAQPELGSSAEPVRTSAPRIIRAGRRDGGEDPLWVPGAHQPVGRWIIRVVQHQQHHRRDPRSVLDEGRRIQLTTERCALRACRYLGSTRDQRERDVCVTNPKLAAANFHSEGSKPGEGPYRSGNEHDVGEPSAKAGRTHVNFGSEQGRYEGAGRQPPPGDR